MLEIQGGVCYTVERLERELFLVRPKDLTSTDFLKDSNCIPVRQDFFKMEVHNKRTKQKWVLGCPHTYCTALLLTIRNMYEATLPSSLPAFP